MRYTTITGEFHIRYADKPRQGPQPDGDTVSFKPNNPALIGTLQRFGFREPDINKRGIISVRFEAIDALETHFGQAHQQLDFAFTARDVMLAALGFQNVIFWDDLPNVVRSVDQDFLPGAIIANGIDGNGRILGFVYTEAEGLADEKETWLDEALMQRSVNFKVLEAGLAYGAIYTSLPVELAEKTKQVARAVRQAQTGLFGFESVNTAQDVAISNLDELESLIMCPKVFRRLVRFFASGLTELTELDGWLRADPINRDDRLLLPNGELGNMHDFIIVENGKMKFRFEPEEVIILPDNA